MKLPRLGEFRVLTLREEVPVLDGSCPEKCVEYWQSQIAIDPRFNGEVETLWGLCLSTRRKVTGCYLIATGTLDTILAHPREVYRPAIVASAGAIVLMHNHPSGDPTPSEADIKVTRDMIRAGELLKIPLLDHIVVGKVSAERTKGYASLREMGCFWQ